MNRFWPYIFIVFAASGLFFHSLGNVHLFDWDEINFAESAREMIETGNYFRVQINYEPFWEKPPFFFWLQVASMKIFGINEFAARFPNALCGIATLLVLFAIGKRLHNVRFASWWVLVYTATFLPHIYFKSGIIDPWFNLFIFLGLYFLVAFLSGSPTRQRNRSFLILSAVFTGLAVLTKGPVAILVVLLSYLLFLFFNQGKRRALFRDYIIWGLSLTAVSLLWFGLEIIRHGWWFVNEFVTYQIRLAKTKDAGHGGFLLYHFVVVLIGCFPASLLIFRFQNQEQEQERTLLFRKMMIASLMVILIVFTVVKTKIVHYSSFAYLPLGYLAATTVDGVVNRTAILKKWQETALLLLGLIWSALFIALPLAGNNIEWIRPLLSKDAFALANTNANVKWYAADIIPGVLFLCAVLVSFIWFRQKKHRRAFILLLFSSMAAIQVLLTLFTPRIERYSQNAAIEFFKRLKGQNVYVKTLGYKSYAQYFYTAVRPDNHTPSTEEHRLLAGPVDRPVYFVSKNTYTDQLMKTHGANLEILYEKNGYVFYRRK